MIAFLVQTEAKSLMSKISHYLLLLCAVEWKYSLSESQQRYYHKLYWIDPQVIRPEEYMKK